MKIAPPGYVGYGRVPDAFANPWCFPGLVAYPRSAWGQRRPASRMFHASPPKRLTSQAGHPRSLTCAGLSSNSSAAGTNKGSLEQGVRGGVLGSLCSSSYERRSAHNGSTSGHKTGGETPFSGRSSSGRFGQGRFKMLDLSIRID
jgi:hypothetical protein